MVDKCAKDVGVPCAAERLLSVPSTWGFLYSRAVDMCAKNLYSFVQPSGCKVCQ